MSSDDASTPGTESPLVHHWNVLRKRRTAVFGFTGALMAAVLVASLGATRYYSATATLEISPKAPVVLDVEKVTDVVPTMYGNEIALYYATQYRIIQSRAVMSEALERLRREHGFTDLDAASDPPMALREFMRVEPEPETHLVRIVIEYPDPQKAALIANTIAQTYMDVNLERTLDSSRQALKWLSEQQEVYRQRQTTSGEQVERYKAENGLISVEDRTPTAESLARLQAAWSDAHTRRVQVEAVVGELKRLSRNAGVIALANHLGHGNPVLGELLDRHETLKQERASLVSRYKEEHPEIVRLDGELAAVESQIRGQVDAIVGGKQAELRLVRNEEEMLAKELERTEQEMAKVGESMIRLKLLQTEAERNEMFFRNLDQRMTEVGLSQFLQANNIRFVDQAIPGQAPVRPQIALNLATALLVGLMGGATLALLLEYVDSSVKSQRDAEAAAGVPFLGVVPLVPKEEMERLDDELDRSIFVHAMPRSTVAECLRTVRTNLMFRAGRQPIRRLLVTSAAPREGKSFISSNLAAMIAMSGQRVLAIDGDLRRPTLHRRFQLSNATGLSNVLLGEMTLADAVQPTHVPGLHALVAGPMPDNPTELVGGGRMEDLLDRIEGYDLILIDSPPVNAVADALVLASMVDGMVFVIQANRTNRNLVAQCCARLREVNPHLLGAVVNKLDVKQAGYEYHYYYNEYGEYYSAPGPADPEPNAVNG